jgi:hypothetical protein
MEDARTPDPQQIEIETKRMLRANTARLPGGVFGTGGAYLPLPVNQPNPYDLHQLADVIHSDGSALDETEASGSDLGGVYGAIASPSPPLSAVIGGGDGIGRRNDSGDGNDEDDEGDDSTASCEDRASLARFLVAGALAVAIAGAVTAAFCAHAVRRCKAATGVPPQGLTRDQIRRGIRFRMARGGQQDTIAEMVRPLHLS